MNRLCALGLLCVVACTGEHGASEPRRHGRVEWVLGATDDAASPYAFSGVRGLAFGEHGRIFVTDSGTNEVRVFSRRGDFEFAIRDSSGAARLCCASIAPDGTLWVVDRSASRFLVFTVHDDRATRDSVVAMPRRPDALTARVQWDQHGDPIAVPNGSRVPPGSRGPVALRAAGPRGDVATALSTHYAVEWLYGPYGTSQLITGQDDASKGQPPIRALGFDLNGRLWVERSVAERRPHIADGYERAGLPPISIDWPDSIDMSLWAIDGTRGLGVIRQAGGVERVALVRFGGPAGAPRRP